MKIKLIIEIYEFTFQIISIQNAIKFIIFKKRLMILKEESMECKRKYLYERTDT